jgi:hypothetical protein
VTGTNPNSESSGGDGGALMATLDSDAPRRCIGAATMENTATRYPFLMLCLVMVITVG